MRGAIGRRLSNPNGFNLFSVVKQTSFLTQPTFHFSSSSSGAGRGRGRGGDGGYSAERGQFGTNREPEKSSEAVTHDSWESPSAGYGHGRGRGRGRGRPISSDPISPGVSSIGRGRGAVKSDVTPFSAGSPPNPQPQEQPQSQTVKPPVDVKQQEIKEASLSPPEPKSSKPALPSDLFNGLGSGISQSNQRIVPGSGAGRGKPMESAPIQQFQEENRHIRRPPPPQQQQSQPQQSQPPPQQQSQPPQQQRQTHPQQQQRSQLQNQRAQTPKDESKGSPKPPFNPEEARKRAMSALSRGEAEGSGVRGRGMRGRGRERGRGRVRGRGGEGWRDDKKEEDAEAEAINTFLGDSADGEKLANKVGPELMSKLAENFEDICDRALPSTANDAFIDAYETNLMIECEPEYLMPDFESNPDIDEKPPMTLRECLEKVKPFIVAYEGIKNQEEWEEAIDEVMARAPLIKEIVDHYSGPDQITAKKQNQELDRIATTIPKTAPDALKRFANRAALTLQSNPGWGYDKKYQFMDKLVRETSQDYK